MATHRQMAEHIKTTVVVSKEIIDASIQGRSRKCMIADALKEAMPWAKSLSVDLQTIRFSDHERGVRYIFLTPPLAQQQLLRFDQGLPIQPWVMKLPVRASQVVKIKAGRNSKNGRNRPLITDPRRLLPLSVTRPRSRTERRRPSACWLTRGMRPVSATRYRVTKRLSGWSRKSPLFGLMERMSRMHLAAP